MGEDREFSLRRETLEVQVDSVMDIGCQAMGHWAFCTVRAFESMTQEITETRVWVEMGSKD